MISYSSSLLHVLDRLRIDYDAAAASDYCHLWNVVAWLLGITPDLLPLERAEMDEIEQLIIKRNQKRSEAGTKMTGALIDLVGSFIVIKPLRGVAASTSRLFIGDETADLLDMPRGGLDPSPGRQHARPQQPVIVAGRARQGHATRRGDGVTPDVVGVRRSRAPR